MAGAIAGAVGPWPYPCPGVGAPPVFVATGAVVGVEADGAGAGVVSACRTTAVRAATTGADSTATGVAAVGAAAAALVAGAAVVCGTGAGCRTSAAGTAGAGCALGADFETTGVDGATRRTTTGFGFATGCRRGAVTARNAAAGATPASPGSAGTVGSVAAWTRAGWVPAGRAEKDGVSLPDGPARKRGIAAAAATAPASNIAATTRSIELMFPTPDADYITRSRYRQHGARA